MAEISAAAVKALRERTGLPMMECKKALEATAGDPDAAIEVLRKAGKKAVGGREHKETAFGRIGVYVDFAGGRSGMAELLCESAPVAAHPEFVELAGDLARQLAVGAGAASGDELLGQPAPSQPGKTLREVFDDLNIRIREAFRVGRLARVEGPCGGYVHHDGTKAVLLEVQGGSPELAKEICMHVVAMRPLAVARDELDLGLVAKEREILTEQTRGEGKPEKMIPKIVEGRMRAFYSQHCLVDQPFVKDANQTVGKVAEAGGMKIVRFVRWELGKE